MHIHERGFISLIFVLGICMTLTTWVGISSSQVFTYIQVRKTFQLHRDRVGSVLACADVVLDTEIRLHLQNRDSVYEIGRSLYIDDPIRCYISNKSIIQHSSEKAEISFDLSTEIGGSRIQVLAEVKNGFIISINTKYTPKYF